MTDLGSLDLDKEEPAPRFPEGGGRGGTILIGLILLALLAGVGYWGYQRFRPRPAVPTPAPPMTSPIATPTPPPLPPLADSDGFIRDLLKAVSPDPRLAEWLAQDNLVRRFAAVVDGLADGGLPTKPLAFLAPKAPFMASDQGGHIVIDPRTHARYDAVADVIASLDAPTCVRVYGWVTPLLDEAYKTLGHPEGGVTKAVDASIAELLGVEVPQGEIALTRIEKAQVTYAFANRDLETLSAAQKSLIRIGPSNAAKVQAKLAEIRGLLSTQAAPTTASPAP